MLYIMLFHVRHLPWPMPLTLPVLQHTMTSVGAEA